MLKKLFLLVMMLGLSTHALAMNVDPAITSPIDIKNIPAFEHYSPVVKDIILRAEKLTQLNLTYLYGSADPKNLGMDCSGTIYYLLKSFNVKSVPRDAQGMFTWAKTNGKLFEVTEQDMTSAVFENLHPGDLLFWSGTYAVKKESKISHVMLYLGKDANNHPLMFGSSNGRYYDNKKMWGVSVFDFKVSTKMKGKFEGFSCIPDLTCLDHSTQQDNLPTSDHSIDVMGKEPKATW